LAYASEGTAVYHHDPSARRGAPGRVGERDWAVSLDGPREASLSLLLVSMQPTALRFAWGERVGVLSAGPSRCPDHPTAVDPPRPGGAPGVSCRQGEDPNPGLLAAVRPTQRLAVCLRWLRGYGFLVLEQTAGGRRRTPGLPADDARTAARIIEVMRGVPADLRRFRRVSAGGRRTAPKPLTEREEPGVALPAFGQMGGSRPTACPISGAGRCARRRALLPRLRWVRSA
jgi:hypothetical protein